MLDDLNNHGRPDHDRINIDDDHEVRNWAQVLGVTAQQVREAVDAVGNRADKVLEHFGARKGQKRASARG
jgi:hypothetical protein